MTACARIGWAAIALIVVVVGVGVNPGCATAPPTDRSMQATIYYSEQTDQRIPELVLDAHDFDVQKSPAGAQIHVTGKIAASYRDLAVDLSGDGFRALHLEPSPQNDVREFELDVPLSGRTTLVRLVAMNARGESHEEQWRIVYPGWGH